MKHVDERSDLDQHNPVDCSSATWERIYAGERALSKKGKKKRRKQHFHDYEDLIDHDHSMDY